MRKTETRQHFTLITLGTDTFFQPTSTIGQKGDAAKYYEKGETLSMIAEVLTDRSIRVESHDDDNEVCERQNLASRRFKDSRINEQTPVIAHKTNDVSVVNGPDTSGSFVGNRIVHGVIEILEAIARGQTEISIIGHSRGAVEALLIAHEINSIQLALVNNVSLELHDIITSNKSQHCTPCSMTKNAYLNMQYSEDGDHEKHKKKSGTDDFVAYFNGLKMKISAHIKQVKINIISIDPVPGNDPITLPVNLIEWQDDRMVEIPNIVKRFDCYICAHEYTGAFIPKFPENPNRRDCDYNDIRIPGHHGTASGNLYDQQFKTYIDKTGCVQQLMLLKCLKFLNENHARFFKVAKDIPLWEMINQYIDLDFSKDFNPRLLELYGQVGEQLQSIEKGCKDTTYAWLASYKLEGNRAVRHGGSKLNKKIDDALAKMDSFVNREHALLTFNEQLGYVDVRNLGFIELIEILTKALSMVIKPEVSNSTLKTSEIADKLKKLIADGNAKELLFQNFCKLISLASEQYSQKDLSQQQQQSLLTNLGRLVHLLSEEKQTEKDDDKEAEKNDNKPTINKSRLLKAVTDTLMTTLNREKAILLFRAAVVIEQVKNPNIRKEKNENDNSGQQDLNNSLIVQPERFDVTLNKLSQCYLHLTDMLYGIKKIGQLGQLIDHQIVTMHTQELNNTRERIIKCAAEFVEVHKTSDEGVKKILFPDLLNNNSTQFDPVNRFYTAVRGMHIALYKRDDALLQNQQAFSQYQKQAKETIENLENTNSSQNRLMLVVGTTHSTRVDELNAIIGKLKKEKEALAERNKALEMQVKESQTEGYLLRCQQFLVNLRDARQLCRNKLPVPGIFTDKEVKIIVTKQKNVLSEMEIILDACDKSVIEIFNDFSACVEKNRNIFSDGDTKSGKFINNTLLNKWDMIAGLLKNMDLPNLLLTKRDESVIEVATNP